MTRQLTVAALTALLALASVGVPAFEHFCAGIPHGVSLLLPEESCGHEAAEFPAGCHVASRALACCAHDAPTNGAAEAEDDCCDDELQWSRAELDLAIGDQHELATPAEANGFVCAAASPIADGSCAYRVPVQHPPPLPTGAYAKTRERLARLQVYRC